MTTAGGYRKLTSNRLLLVEGRDEENLLHAMLEHWGIDSVQITGIGGRSGFNSKLDAVLAQARATNLQLAALGVMLDADDSPQDAMKSVVNALQSSGLPVPNRQGEFVKGTPSVGIFIVPDGSSRGSVEHLCWESIEDTDTAICALSYLKCLQDSTSLKSRNAAKTLIHAYLAAQEDPYTRAGEGGLKGYWPFDHPAFSSVKEFLHSLAAI